MQQKITWSHCLIIGISLATIFLIRCDRLILSEDLKTIQYIYKNQTKYDLVMDVFSEERSLIDSYNIATKEQVISHTHESGGPSPSFYASNTSSVGDSIVIKYSSDECVFWLRNFENRIFNPEEYDNYSEELLKEDEYQLVFSIIQSDLDQATDCN